MINSGIIVHIVTNKNHLFNLKLVYKMVKWGKVKNFLVKYIRNLKLKIFITGQYFIILRLYFIHKLRFNLLFISKLIGCYIIINKRLKIYS